MEMAIRTVHMPWYFFCRTIDPIYMCYTYSPRATNRECVWASVVITQIIRALNGTKRGHNSFIECLPNDVWTHLSGIFARYKNGEKNVTNVRAASMICSMCLGLFSTPFFRRSFYSFISPCATHNFEFASELSAISLIISLLCWMKFGLLLFNSWLASCVCTSNGLDDYDAGKW